jgi:hypothetical protein
VIQMLTLEIYKRDLQMNQDIFPKSYCTSISVESPLRKAFQRLFARNQLSQQNTVRGIQAIAVVIQFLLISRGVIPPAKCLMLSMIQEKSYYSVQINITVKHIKFTPPTRDTLSQD